jgi:ubiquinone/menaquinone biosynthesis C-methylase UbiE
MKEQEYARMFRLEDRYWWFRGRRELVRRLLAACRVWTSGDRILDLGCGTGATLSMLGGFGRACGLDASPEALRFCRARGGLSLVRGLAGDLPFRDASFDAVVALDLLEHVGEDGNVLREMCRVTRPGGRVVLTVPALAILWSAHDEALHHQRRYGARDLGERVRGAGFSVEKLSFAMFFLFLPILLCRLYERVLGQRDREPETSLVRVPAFLNESLFQLLRVEAGWVVRSRFPVGVSLVCVGRKPGEE